MNRYLYNRLEQRLGCVSEDLKQTDLQDQTLSRNDGPMQTRVDLSFLHGPVIKLEDAEICVSRDRNGMVVLKTPDGLRNYAGVQYTLFFMLVADMRWEFSDGPLHKFSGWVSRPLQFYPADWDQAPTIVEGDDVFPPDVLALNLPSFSRPMRVTITLHHNHKDWSI